MDKKDARWGGAEAGTNNTAEVTAIIRALAWAAKQPTLGRVCIRYDSEYACKMTVGEWHPKANIGLIRAARRQLASTRVKSLAGMKEQLSTRGVVFAPSQYKREAGTQQAMRESSRALQYLALLKHGGGETPAGARKRRTTLKSYMLQEAEAASREAKLSWCQQAGIRVVSLQHDGIVAMVVAGEACDHAAQGMAKVATAACGYKVKVIPKRASIVVD